MEKKGETVGGYQCNRKIDEKNGHATGAIPKG